MLPIFVTAGRGQYSKALRLYLEQMTVQEIQYGALVKTFKVVGLHTVRYTDHEWSGVWTDLSITEEDRDFLLNHWQNTISSTRDLQTKVAVEKKLARAEKSLKFDLSPTTPQASSSLTLEPSPNGDSKNSISSTEEYTPKRFYSRPSGFGTTVDISIGDSPRTA